MLSFLLSLPFFGIFLIIAIPSRKHTLIKQTAFLCSSIVFLFSLVLWIFFDDSTPNFQYIEFFNWNFLFNVNFFLGVDGISLFFILLSTLLVCVCILNSWLNINKQIKLYMIFFLLMEFFLIVIFSVLDIIVFYVFLKVYLYPCFLLSVFGVQELVN